MKGICMPRRRSFLSSFALVLASTVGMSLSRAANAAPGKVDVTVVDSSGAPVAGANVELHHRKHIIAHGKTDSTGHFVFERAPSGKDGVDAGKKEVGRGRAEVTVKNGETASVTLTIKKKKK